MKWIRRRKVAEIKPDTHTRVEIVAHQNATKKQVEKVKQANRKLQDAFEHNNFTVKLVLAAKE